MDVAGVGGGGFGLECRRVPAFPLRRGSENWLEDVLDEVLTIDLDEIVVAVAGAMAEGPATALTCIDATGFEAGTGGVGDIAKGVDGILGDGRCEFDGVVCVRASTHLRGEGGNGNANGGEDES